jgi:2-polyprenyl-6-methoxyphenol hydroxylase-like FAD-dependent oxidoreductase
VHHDDETAELKRRFGTWHDPIPGLMGTVAPGDVLHDVVYWIAEPLPAYHRGRVAILGDAAHAIRDDIPDRHRAAEHRDLAWLGASHPR